MDTDRTDDPKRNPDPITKAPGSHPIGTGVGERQAALRASARLPRPARQWELLPDRWEPPCAELLAQSREA